MVSEPIPPHPGKTNVVVLCYHDTVFALLTTCLKNYLHQVLVDPACVLTDALVSNSAGECPVDLNQCMPSNGPA